jgi:hypothetical protein
MTVFANGKPIVHQGAKGKATFIDVCLTPPLGIPIPFSNLAQTEDLDKCAQTVFINNKPIAHEKSIFKKTSGDEGGIAGVASGTINSIAKFLKGSPDVFVEDFAVVRHGDLVVSNNNNTPSSPIVVPGMEMPPQLKSQYDAQKKTKPTPYVKDVDMIGANLNTLDQMCGFTDDLAITNQLGGNNNEEIGLG